MRNSGVAGMVGRNRWAATALALLLCAGCAPDEERGNGGSAAQLRDSLAGLEQVARDFPPVDDAPLHWPGDHAAHPEQFTESWLVAGRLVEESGGVHGFQLLLQRVALATGATGRESAWAADSAWHGRFVLEQPGVPQLAAERVSRAALGLAGSTSQPPAAWVEGWRLEVDPESGVMTLQARDPSGGLDLRLTLPARDPAPLAADARRGYWWPGLQAAGTIRRGDAVLAVQGSALLERWWGRAPPAGSGQLALVRLWLVDATGGAVRCEQLRRRGGGGTPLGACTAYPSGLELAASPEPVGDPAAGVVPLRWRLDWDGGERAWAPLAAPGDPRGEWAGLLAPAAAADTAPGWGFLALSNFAAP